MENLAEEIVQIKEMSIFKRLVNIIFDPVEAFNSIVEKQKVLVPIILITVVLTLLAVPKAPVVEDYNRDTVSKIYKSEAFLKTAQLTPEQADKTVETTSKISKIMSYFAALAAFAALLLQALVFFAVFKMLKGTGSFVQTFSILTYTYLIKLIGEAVRTINVMISGKADVTNSFALLMANDDKTSFIYNLISSIDLFSIWALAVAAVGLAVVHNISRKKAYITVFSIWAVYVLGMSAYVTFSAVSMYNKYGVTM